MVDTVIEAGDIIDNEHFGSGYEQGVFDLVFEVLLVAAELIHFIGLRIGDRTAEFVAEFVVMTVFGAVALLKLLIAQFIINIQYTAWRGRHLQRGDGFAFADAIPYLHRQHRFARVGIGEHNAQLVFEPKMVEQHFGFGQFGAITEPFTGSFNNELGFGAIDVFFRVLELPGGWLGLKRFGNWVNATDSIANFFDHSGAFHVMVGFVGIIHEDKFGSHQNCFRKEQL